jgi:hypothetical protein
MISAMILSVKLFIMNEFRKIRDDESGIEVVQVVIILLIVIVIAVALWAFLGGYIRDLLARITNEAPSPVIPA